MTEPGFALFDTAIGMCAVAWGARGIRAVQLPETTSAATRRRIARRFPELAEVEPPPALDGPIASIRALLAGRADDLTAIAVDMDGVPDFNRRVFEVARTIAPGRTLSYGEIAKRLGGPGDARDVGRALGENPFPLVVPCHRVVGADGAMVGFSAAGGVTTKLRLLAIEGSDASPPSLFDQAR